MLCGRMGAPGLALILVVGCGAGSMDDDLPDTQAM